MDLPEFELERYFAHYEFEVPHLLGASDVEAYRLDELLALSGEEERALWGELSLGYTESAGGPLLRGEVSGLYETVDREDVLVFSGAEEAVFVLLNVVLGPGDHAVVTWPAYASLHEVARAAGAEVTLLPLEHERGWALDLDALRAAVRPETRLIVTNFPHNPTGALPDAATFRGVVEVAREAGAYLLSDEVYRLLEHEPSERLPAAVDLYEWAISLGVMSKAFALAGLRIGWISTHDRDLLRRCAAFKDYTTICNSAPSEALSLIALKAREKVLARSREIIDRNLPYADRFFQEWRGVFDTESG
ncbi:MAG: aminotransferase class I/II-fold pyridoxal phosphate-dependent enzyme [Rubrobacter sp.]|nr:aminotransferase class I/II-fold pyridoxal phosphate-dependent enzyme [Rubrobacter sp.]